MSSRRVLIVLSLVTALLAAIVVVGGGPKHAAKSLRVVPEYRPGRVASVVVHRQGKQPLRLARPKQGEPLVLVKPVRAAADADAVEQLLGTIETLHWTRHVAGKTIESPEVTITVELDDGEVISLALGQSVSATGQVWLSRTGRPGAYLIEAYAARALDRGVDELRRRRVFDTQADVVSGVELHVGNHSFVLSSSPWSVHLAGGGSARIRSAEIATVIDQLQAARLIRFAPSLRRPTATAYTLRLLGSAGVEQVVHVGACPEDDLLWLVDTPAGRGCVNPAPFIALQRLGSKPLALVEHRLLVAADRVVSLDVTQSSRTLQMRRRGASWFGGDNKVVSASAVRAWLDGFAQLSTPTHRRDVIVATELARVKLGYQRGGADVVHIVGNKAGVLFGRRNDEPLFFELTAAATTWFDELPSKLRNRDLLVFEPLGMNRARALRRGRVVAKVARGATHSDWTVAVPTNGTAQLAAIDALRRTIAQLTALRFVQRQLGAVRRRVEASFDKTPAAPAADITIDVGAQTKNGCLASLTRQPFVFELSRSDCAALLGAWSSP